MNKLDKDTTGMFGSRNTKCLKADQQIRRVHNNTPKTHALQYQAASVPAASTHDSP